MPDVTLGTTSVTGVYARGRLSPGVYVGTRLVWPPPAPGVFAVGVGTFELLGRGVLTETDQSIRINPSSMTLVGRPLSVGAGTSANVVLGTGELTLQASTFAASAAAAPQIAPASLSFEARALDVSTSRVLAMAAGAVHFAPRGLTIGLANEVSLDATPGALQFAYAPLTVTVGHAASVDVPLGTFTFASQPLAPTTAFAATTNAGALGFEPAALAVDLGASVEASVAVGAFDITSAPLTVGHGVALDVAPGAIATAGAIMQFAQPQPSVSASWWRIKINAIGGGSYATVTEMALHATAGGTDLCVGGSPFASSQLSASNAIAYAFDDNLNTSWAAASSTLPAYLGYHMASASPVAEMTLTAPGSGSYPLPMPTSFELQYSTDSTNGLDGTWTTVWTVTGLDPWSIGEERTFDGSYAAPIPMTLSGSLPWNPAVGTTYHGEMTLAGDFVAPVTIDAETGAIPTWMITTVSGNTVNFDGTVPGGPEMDAFYPRATDSSATPQQARGPQQLIGSVPVQPPGQLATGWRIVIVDNDGATSAGQPVTAMGELEMRTGVGAANACTGGAGYGGPPEAPAADALFDGDPSTTWSYTSPQFAHYAYYFWPDADALIVTDLEIVASPGVPSPNGAPTRFFVQSSVSNATGAQNWVTEWSVETTPDWGAGEARSFHRPGTQPLLLDGTLLSRALVRQPYHSALVIRGDAVWPLTVDISVGVLPPWLTMTVANNLINFDGTAPDNTETDSFTVRVTDSSSTPQVATSAQTLNVENAPSVKGWRLALINGGPSGTPRVDELELVTTLGSASLTSGGTAFASSSPELAPLAFDGFAGDDNDWDTVTSVFPVYLGYLLPTPAVINHFVLWENNTGGAGIPWGSTAYELQSSSDTTDGLDGTWLTEWSATLAPSIDENRYVFTRPGYVPVPMSLSGTLAGATAGEPYNGSLTLSGDFVVPVTVTGLASWMAYSVHGTKVSVTGTPASGDVGTDSLTVVATDSSTPTAQTAQCAQTVTVAAAPVPMTLTGTLPDATAGAAYDAHLTLGGDFVAPVTITASAGTLPAWMTFVVSGTDVHVTGTAPASAETDNFTVRATDSTTPTAQTADAAQTVTVTVPAITLDATFPASPHVGDAVSFDVTATLSGGATGTPTITVDQLPAGLSIGATSMVDASHYKATVSGTLTTVQDVTSTFGTTGGSVAATALVHEFNVTAAPTAAELVNVGSSANSGTTVNMSVPITAAAGDTILAVLSARQGATNTGPAGFTLEDDYIAVASTSMGEILVYTKTADGTETSVDATSNRSFGSAALQVWKVPGGGNIQTFQGGRGGSGAVTSWSVGPFTPPADNAIVIAMWSSGAQLAEGTYGVDAGWNAMTIVDTATSSNLGLASLGWTTQQQTTATAATATFSASGGVNNPTDYMIAVSK